MRMCSALSQPPPTHLQARKNKEARNSIMIDYERLQTLMAQKEAEANDEIARQKQEREAEQQRLKEEREEAVRRAAEQSRREAEEKEQRLKEKLEKEVGGQEKRTRPIECISPLCSLSPFLSLSLASAFSPCHVPNPNGVRPCSHLSRRGSMRGMATTAATKSKASRLAIRSRIHSRFILSA